MESLTKLSPKLTMSAMLSRGDLFRFTFLAQQHWSSSVPLYSLSVCFTLLLSLVYKKAAKRGVAAVGDERAQQKDDKYAAMAKMVDAEFSAFVLYTYGGFHSSALSFIDKLAAGCDPAVALVPLADWKDDLKDRIAVCVQRHTADIVIDDARRARMASIPVRGRAAGGPSGRLL